MIVSRTPPPPMEVQFVETTDPDELARIRQHQERAQKNTACWRANAKLLYQQYLGMHICIAGGEYFVAEDVLEADRLGQRAHPDDDARLVIYVPKEKMIRIYAT
jgi:hypothetical protein